MTKKIVTIGGGTGHYTLLRGLKNYDVSLSAIVSVFDNGGSSGKIREELVDFGALAPGDIRNCLLALTDESSLSHMVKLLDFRFPQSGGTLSNHNLGNFIITASQQLYGKADGIKIVSKMLGIKDHQVIPVSIDSSMIYAKTISGNSLQGQLNVSYPNKEEKIELLWLEPPAHVNIETALALKNANVIVICPGDLYGSILPNFLVKGLKESISKDARIVYVCNLVTKQGTHNFKASDFVKEIEKYMERKIDFVICNTKKPTELIVDKYMKEDSYFVEPDFDGPNILKSDLLIECKSDSRVIARHDAEKVARLIMNLL